VKDTIFRFYLWIYLTPFLGYYRGMASGVIWRHVEYPSCIHKHFYVGYSIRISREACGVIEERGDDFVFLFPSHSVTPWAVSAYVWVELNDTVL
jgi:hypothetical protein